MKIQKTQFLAVGIAAALIMLSSGVQAQESHDWGNDNSTQQTTNNTEFSKSAGNFFSKMGSAIKSGVSKVGETTGEVMKKTGKGIQHLAEAADSNKTDNVEVATNETKPVVSKKSSSDNIKNIRNKASKPKNDTVQSHIF